MRSVIVRQGKINFERQDLLSESDRERKRGEIQVYTKERKKQTERKKVTQTNRWTKRKSEGRERQKKRWLSIEVSKSL